MRYYGLIFGGLLLGLPSAALSQQDIGTTTDFVQQCGTSKPGELCVKTLFDEYGMHNMDELMANGLATPDICFPHGTTAHPVNKAHIVRVTVQWLKEHPENNDKGLREAIVAALVALYPCK